MKDGGGNGTSGGVSDDWKASVDRQLGQLHGDVRNLLYALIGGFLVLIAAIGGLYLHVDGKFDRIDGKFDKVDERAGQTEVRLARIEEKLDLLLERKSLAASPTVTGSK